MIAKLIAHGQSRAEAFAKLADALATLDLGPLIHNGSLLLRLCEELDVLAMGHHTQWPIPTTAQPIPELAWPLATLWLASRPAGTSPWQQTCGFRLGPDRCWTAAVRIGDERRVLTLHDRDGQFEWQGETRCYQRGDDNIRLQQGGCWQLIPIRTVPGSEETFIMTLAGQRIRFAAADQLHSHHHDRANEKVQGAIAPMHGIVVAVLVEQGQTVSKGQPLLVLEAMKMEHQLRAERDGIIEALQCKQGEQVSQGAVLVRFAEETTSLEDHP